MLTIAKKQLTFLIPDCSIIAPLMEDKTMTKSYGIYHGLGFSISPKELIIDEVSYQEDINWTEEIMVKHDVKYYFCLSSDDVQSFFENTRLFKFEISQSKKPLSVENHKITYSVDGAEIIVCLKPSVFEEKLVQIIFKDPSNKESPYYKISYALGEQGIEKTVEKYDATFRNKLDLDFNEEQIRQLTFDRLGFRDLQITVE